MITFATTAPQRARQILGSLEAVGYEVRVARVADHVTAEVMSSSEAAVLDVTDADRRTVTALVRRLAGSRVPLIVFSASPDPDSGIAGLEAGADDLLTATMSSSEVSARLRAALRRSRGVSPRSSVVLTGGPVVIDSVRRRVEISGKAVFLTALELKLLSYFLMHPDQPISRDRLLEEVWGYSVGGTSTVTVHVRRLREKIEEDPADPMLIRTVWGIGYRFSPAAP